MAFESDKIMFEIYRETTYTGKYRVVYFTELQDHNKQGSADLFWRSAAPAQFAIPTKR
jgi:hypothetical protein